jgi:hypothetical protein
MDAESWMRQNWTPQKRAELIEQIKGFSAEELRIILTMILSDCHSEVGMAPALRGTILGVAKFRAEFAEQIALMDAQAKSN